ncbi:MAG: DUF2264 domain-containing protein [Reichenbachiella sp.]
MKKEILVICFLVLGYVTYAQPNLFKVNNPNYQLSPYTGMTKSHWYDAADYLLSGAFSHVDQLTDPMLFPKQPGPSYPHEVSQNTTAKLEGLCRTLFVAAPLLKNDPNLSYHGINVAEYYRYHILQLLDSTSDTYVANNTSKWPSQTLVEFGALAISLKVIPEQIWEPLPTEKKDSLALKMLSYAHGATVPSNWKFFNIFVLSFFKEQGYAVNEDYLTELLTLSLEHYRGDGWYNDNPAYDYYSMWAFQMYGFLWSDWYGNEQYPDIAQKFISNFEDLQNNYIHLFSKQGQMIMWGRSISYRMGSIVPFPLMGALDQPTANLGWGRRVASGVLLQFLENPDFLDDQVPTLGFYGPFDPATQQYSCRASTYWMGKAFLGLLVPDSSGFWTAKENLGEWEKDDLANGKVVNHFTEGAEILVSDYGEIGASEIRAWCHVPLRDQWEKFRGSENYNRLSYNSAFPWQEDGANGEVAMNYLIKGDSGVWEALHIYDFISYENGVYRRKAILETVENVEVQLVDIPLDRGVLRIDRISSNEVLDIRLGHYALPVLDGDIVCKGKNKLIVMDNNEYQLAMVNVSGWGQLESIQTTGLHPQSNNSGLINGRDQLTSKAKIYISLMLWKPSGSKFTKRELSPIKVLNQSDKEVTIRMADGSTKHIVFE